VTTPKTSGQSGPSFARAPEGALRPGDAVRTWIVVPCYNEESRLDMEAYAAALAGNPDLGFVLVNDGSKDRTLELLSSLIARFGSRVEVIDQQPNQGKAEAVRVGMQCALRKQGDYAGYFDADLATPLDEVPAFVRALDENPAIDIVLGARVALLGRDIDRKPSRHYLGRVFATAASLVLSLPVYDTQCGAKLFRSNEATRALFAKRFGSRWIFDVELIARYLNSRPDKRGLFELPVRRWTDVGESRVKGVDFVRAVGELAEIYRTYRMQRSVSGWLRVITAPFVRYVGAGGIGTILHYLTLFIVVSLSSVKASIASMLGALVGALTNYILNYHLTFASKMPHRRTLPRFLVVAAISMLLTGAGMELATERLGIHFVPAQLACTVMVLVVGYVLNKIWTFAVPGQSVAPPATLERPLTSAPSQSATTEE
jgi:dolichyl-phosphate beta-glucosyltransferase